MANQVVVSPLLELVSDKLADLIYKGFGVAWHVEKEMKKLSQTLSRIKYLVIDAEDKQVTNFAIRDWLQDLKDVACTAEDVLEEWEFECPLQVASETTHNNFVEKLTNSLKELADIANENRQFHLQKGVVEKIFRGRETGSLLTEPVYGREEDKRILVRRILVPHPSQHNHPSSGEGSSTNKVNSLGHISVCPILGIGGVGKTTLAKLVYNDEQVARHFEVRAWTCVSDDFEVNSIIRRIIASLSGDDCNIKELDPLQRCLQEKLRGKKFLLVLDDVWEESQNEWNEVMGTLACGAKGSCVIVTTRLEMVASIIGTIPFHRLDRLSENDCCALFKQRAFGSKEEKERSDLMEIGNEIVKKCKGVPLAAKALGGLLRFKREPRQWETVKNNEIWQLPDNDILPALRLSYNHLPPQLRQCFAYCAIYKKDSEIDREELISLWIANGFVHSRGSVERLEDVGNEIFEALLWRSFFQDATNDRDGNILKCKMHDLMHDLACHVGDGCTMAVESSKNIPPNTRHLSLFWNSETSHLLLEFIRKCPPSLRSLVMGYSFEEYEEHSQLIFSHLICLRALDLSETSIAVLPDNIGDMKHLRYLNLSGNPITSLPESVCKLISLERLNLVWCEELETLPKDMSEMSRLRHLDIRDCFGLTKMPIGIGKLTCLQTLSSFVVGLESGGGLNELGGLNKIEGLLEISGLKKVRNPMDAKEANLLQKENLCSLTLLWDTCWDCADDDETSGDEEMVCESATATEVMKGLQPPSNLRRFVVRDYNGVSFPSLLLPKLVQMQLSTCSELKFIDEGSEALSAGGFKSLQVLELEMMPELEGWSSLLSSSRTGGGGGEAGKVASPVTIKSQSSLSSSQQQEAVEEEEAAKLLFPCLKTLTLRVCPKLSIIPLPSCVESVLLWQCNQRVLEQLKNLSRLSHLNIGWFYELKYFPQDMLINLAALEKLEIINCNKVEAMPEGLMNLSSLRSLIINRCDCLKHLPQQLNKSFRLVEMEIGYCPELEFNMEEDFQNLVALQTLSLKSLPKLARFPEGIKQAARRLRSLFIEKCSEEVMDLPNWIGALTSLQYLSIDGCKNRKVLPEDLQHFTALRQITINGCDPELERRCKRDIGEDWSKIAHVPHIFINTIGSKRAERIPR